MDYQEIVMSKTDSEIKKLFKNLMKNKKGYEASKLRTAYILYHTTENEVSHRDLLSEFLVYDKLQVDVVYGVNAEDSESKISIEQQDLCGINAFLTAKTFLKTNAFLSYFGKNNIHLAEDLLKKELPRYFGFYLY